MRVLQICVKPPFPEVDGGAIAMAGTLRSLINIGCDLTVFSFVSHKHPEMKIPKNIEGKFRLHTAPVNLQIKPFDAFLNLFSNESYHAKRFRSKAVKKLLTQILEEREYDIVLLETVFPTVYLKLIREHSKAKVIIRMHNIEHKVWERTADKEARPLKRWYIHLLAARLKQFELKMLSNVDGLIAISQDDENKLINFGVNTESKTIPVGLELGNYQSNAEGQMMDHSIFHLAAMDWIPNQKAVDWFFCFVWDELLELQPKVKLHLAGRKMPTSLFNKISPNLFVQDEVPSAVEFMMDKSIMIVPLLSGSGLRIKILEGMAMGKAIVSTTVGVSGLAVKNGEHLFIADSPKTFAEKICMLLDDPELVRKMGLNARKLVEEKYSLEMVAAETGRYLESFLNNN